MNYAVTWSAWTDLVPLVKDIINLDAVPCRRHENFRREGHLVAIGVRERETSSVSLTPMVIRCPSRRKFSCRLLGTASRFIISLPWWGDDNSYSSNLTFSLVLSNRKFLRVQSKIFSFESRPTTLSRPESSAVLEFISN